MRSIFGATLIVRHVLTATHLVCTAVRKPLQFSVGNSDWFRKQKTIRLSSLIVNIQLPKYISALHMHAIGVYIYIYILFSKGYGIFVWGDACNQDSFSNKVVVVQQIYQASVGYHCMHPSLPINKNYYS